MQSRRNRAHLEEALGFLAPFGPRCNGDFAKTALEMIAEDLEVARIDFSEFLDTKSRLAMDVAASARKLCEAMLAMNVLLLASDVVVTEATKDADFFGLPGHKNDDQAQWVVRLRSLERVAQEIADNGRPRQRKKGRPRDSQSAALRTFMQDCRSLLALYRKPHGLTRHGTVKPGNLLKFSAAVWAYATGTKVPPTFLDSVVAGLQIEHRRREKIYSDWEKKYLIAMLIRIQDFSSGAAK